MRSGRRYGDPSEVARSERESSCCCACDFLLTLLRSNAKICSHHTCSHSYASCPGCSTLSRPCAAARPAAGENCTGSYTHTHRCSHMSFYATLSPLMNGLCVDSASGPELSASRLPPAAMSPDDLPAGPALTAATASASGTTSATSGGTVSKRDTSQGQAAGRHHCLPCCLPWYIHTAGGSNIYIDIQAVGKRSVQL
jgi:hypothetical protein